MTANHRPIGDQPTGQIDYGAELHDIISANDIRYINRDSSSMTQSNDGANPAPVMALSLGVAPFLHGYWPLAFSAFVFFAALHGYLTPLCA